MTPTTDRPAGHLQKTLGFAFAMAIGIGSVIGAGILRTPGPVADLIPSLWLILALWGLGGVHALLGANVASELITSIPKAGGTYVPVRAAFGESMGLLVGWVDWLAFVAACAALSVVCANFLALLVPTLATHTAWVATGFALSLIVLNWIGVKEGAIAQTLGSTFKFIFMCLIIGIIFLVAPDGSAGASEAVGPTVGDVATPIGFFAVIVAYQMIYGAYAGWGVSIYFVEEDPKAISNIPRAMVLTILTITLVYLALNASLLKALPIDMMRTSDLPIALAMEQIFGAMGGKIVAAIALVLASTCLNANIMATPRVLYGLGRDGLFLPIATRVNKGGTPDVALGISGVLTIALIFSGGFEFLFLLMGALTIFIFVAYDASLFALRIRQPDLPRPFRSIGYPWLPGFVLLLDTGLLIAFLAADPASGFYMLGLIALCIPVGHHLAKQRKLAAAI
jgi:amino acid transporter